MFVFRNFLYGLSDNQSKRKSLVSSLGMQDFSNLKTVFDSQDLGESQIYRSLFSDFTYSKRYRTSNIKKLNSNIFNNFGSLYLPNYFESRNLVNCIQFFSFSSITIWKGFQIPFRISNSQRFSKAHLYLKISQKLRWFSKNGFHIFLN